MPPVRPASLKVRAHLGVPLIIDAAPLEAANEELADKPRKTKAA